MRQSPFAAALFVILAGCDKQAPEPTDSATALDAIHKVEQAQVDAFANRDVEEGLAPYADDSSFAQSGTPYLEGLAAIRPAIEAMLADPAAKLDLTPKDSFVAASGDLAVTTAEYAFTYTNPKTEQPTTEHGVNQTVWQKQADGSWKNVSDFNVATAPTELK